LVGSSIILKRYGVDVRALVMMGLAVVVEMWEWHAWHGVGGHCVYGVRSVFIGLKAMHSD
jgi:hypothetical protein